MPEYDAFRTVFGTVPGGGKPDPKSNTSYKNHDLGLKVVGLDSSGYRGEWVYCLAWGTLTAKAPLAVLGNLTATALTVPAEYRVCMEADANGLPPGSVPIVGAVDQAVTDTYYCWVRTRGIMLAVPWYEVNLDGTGRNVGVIAAGTTSPGKWLAGVPIGYTYDTPAFLARGTAAGGGDTTADIYLGCHWL